jgi:hypothetical protein
LSFEFDVGRGSSPGHVLHRFLLALYTNLAADVAKLGVCCARTGGDTEARTSCTRNEFEISQRSPKRGGSILIFQIILAVNLIRKAVVADRHNYADRVAFDTFRIGRFGRFCLG